MPVLRNEVEYAKNLQEEEQQQQQQQTQEINLLSDQDSCINNMDVDKEKPVLLRLKNLSQQCQPLIIQFNQSKRLKT